MGKYSDYKGVSLKKVNGVTRWICRYKTEETRHDSEREAAINYDKKRIKAGEKPENILKPVEK